MSNAQSEFQDFETWYRFKCDMKLNDFKVHVRPGIRLKENSTQLKVGFSDFGVSYKVHKYFTPSFNYRFSIKNRFDIGAIQSHRLNVDLKTGTKYGPFNFQLRNRLQRDTDYKGADWANRTKLKVAYFIGEGMWFFTSAESWIELKAVSYMSKYRMTFGLDLKLFKRNEIKIYYMRQGLVADYRPEKYNIIGITYNLRLKSVL